MNVPSLRGRASVLVLCCLLGCGRDETGDGPPREAVSGTVTLDGRPVDAASIQFLPVDPGSASETSAEIKDGKFEIGVDRGPVAGSYKVAISSQLGPDVQPGELPGESAPIRPDPIPAKYNTKTSLTAEVKTGGPNTFDFPLKKR